MKLLLDQGTPRSTVAHLAAVGIVAEHVGNLGMATAADTTILEFARQQQAVIVTLNADFHRLLAYSHATSPSVIRIRIERLKGDALASILRQVLATADSDLIAGAAISVTPDRVRIHSLPIGR